MNKKLNQRKRPNGAGTVVPVSSFDPLKCLALYAGQFCLGHLLHSARGVKAFVDGASIGIFPNQKLAADALTKKAAAS
jgi:hypothetical protein